MKRALALALALLAAPCALAQVAAPPPTALTPANMVYSLAVKRNWTEQSTPFCSDRANTNAGAAYPRAPKAKYKFVRTFGFTSNSSPSIERLSLEYLSTRQEGLKVV